MITPKILVDQMQEMAPDALPEAMSNGVGAESPGPGLQEWLEEMYFDGERNEDLTSEDIVNK